MSSAIPRRTGVLLGVAGLVLAAGCSTPAQPIAPPVVPPLAFSVAGAGAMPPAWWTVLGDPALDAAIDTALTANFDLLVAWQRLQAARALARREAGALVPAVEAFADADVRVGAETGDDATLGLGLSAAYEVDLWGRIRSSVEAERMRAAATRADYQAAALTLSAEVARTWARLAEAQNQVALIDEQIATNTIVLQLIENRFGLGLVRAVDILRQRQLIEATREQRTVAEARRQVLAHQLSVLLGRPPQEGPGLEPDDLPTLPPLPATGVPLDLVRRRPDVEQGYLRLQAADREVAAAVASQFPRLTLSASPSTAVEAPGDVFTGWIGSLAGSLVAPLFYGGALRAEVDRTEAVRAEALYRYGQTVLVAFQEVEDALVLEARQRERLALIETQLGLASQAYEQLQVQYLNGASNYLEVLTALDEVQSLRRDLLAARLELVEQRLALYRALAGPVETPREAS